MICSIFYFISAVLLLIVLAILPKTKDKQNFTIWLPVYVIAYEYYTCLVGGIFTILHIPAQITTIGFANTIISLVLICFLVKKKRFQKYYFNKLDFILLGVLIIFFTTIALIHFTPDLLIRFETSDPGPHLKAAMDAVNSQSVLSNITNMYVGQFTNALWIELLEPLFNGVYVYKSFIVKNIINFVLSSLIFYSCIRMSAQSKKGQFIGVVFTCLYVMGYPLNDLLFGFVYLGMSITGIAFLYFVMQIYLDTNSSQYFSMILLSLGCLGVGQGYTFFAPIVFVAVLLCMIYKNIKDNASIKALLNIKFVMNSLFVFLLPTILCLWYSLIYPKISGSGWDNAGIMQTEGYIYRNLYADFLVFLPFALYAMYKSIRKKNINLFTFLMPITVLYCAFFYWQTLQKNISTYYYYKLNFVLWLIIVLLCTNAVLNYIEKKAFVLIYFFQWMLVLIMTVSGIDDKICSTNVLYNPFPNAHSAFEVFVYNKIIFERKSEIDYGLVELCQQMPESTQEQPILFVGDWMESYWYEALTNQRISSLHIYNNLNQILNDYLNEKFSPYIAVAKDSKEYQENTDMLNSLERVFENDYGFIAKVN